MLSRQWSPNRLRIFTAVGLLVVAALAGGTAIAQAAPPNPPGNNGTVKIHQGAVDDATNAGNGNDIDNDPHVCTFHLHFFFADAGQTGVWKIESWPPTGDGTVVLSGTYLTKANGEDRQPEQGAYSLPDGHYKLFWEGSTDQTWKQKVFWVDCPSTSPSPVAGASGSVSPSPSASVEASVSPSASVEASVSPSASVAASVAASVSPSPSGGVGGISIGSASPSEITTGGGVGEITGSASPGEITTGGGVGEISIGSAGPTGQVAGIVGTPPPTDTSGPSGSTQDPLQTLALLLLAISAFLGGITLLAPLAVRRR